MYVKNTITFEFLVKNCWSGALDTLQKIRKENKTEELIDLLEDLFVENYIPTITEINDFLWFSDTEIYRDLEIEIEE